MIVKSEKRKGKIINLNKMLFIIQIVSYLDSLFITDSIQSMTIFNVKK